jgi:hypothetical protein
MNTHQPLLDMLRVAVPGDRRVEAAGLAPPTEPSGVEDEHIEQNGGQ